MLDDYHDKNLRVAAIKPIETGVGKYPPDGSKLLEKSKALNPKLDNLTIEDIVPITFSLPAAPYVAAGGETIPLEPIFEAIERFTDLCDVLLIEGAGGLFVPINKEYYMIDLIHDLNVDETILVTHCDLGCINDTLLSHNALEAAGIPHKTVFNCKNGNENFQKLSKPYFDAIGFKIEMV